jgi:hypothetical protein
MPTERANDLYALKCFIDAQLATETVPTVDEVLARWNYENESEERGARSEKTGSKQFAVGSLMLRQGESGLQERQSTSYAGNTTFLFEIWKVKHYRALFTVQEMW